MCAGLSERGSLNSSLCYLTAVLLKATVVESLGSPGLEEGRVYSGETSQRSFCASVQSSPSGEKEAYYFCRKQDVSLRSGVGGN